MLENCHSLNQEKKKKSNVPIYRGKTLENLPFELVNLFNEFIYNISRYYEGNNNNTNGCNLSPYYLVKCYHIICMNCLN